ncbi:MAG: hypothetical protein IPK52_15980 [Chloroflexi bacterium]|nr:hypothetical protein [Chloroflexota bacterium]
MTNTRAASSKVKRFALLHLRPIASPLPTGPLAPARSETTALYSPA